MNAYGTPILSPLWDQADGPLGRMSVNPRYIRTFDGTSTYGALNDPIILAAGDTIEIEFSSTTTATLKEIIDGIIQFDAGDLLQLTNCTATIDGTAVATGASIAAYLDGVIHTIILTMTGADIATYIGSSAVPSNYFSGEILSVKFTDNSGATPVVTNYVIDNDSTVYSQARGYTLSADIVINGDFSAWTGDDPDNWVVVGENGTNYITENSGSARIVSVDVFLGLHQNLGMTVGNTYILEFEITESIAGSIKLSSITDGGTDLGTYSTAGKYTIPFNAGSATLYIVRATLVTDISITNVIVKPVQKSIAWSSFVAGDIERFTYNYTTRCWEAAVHADICYV